MKKLTFILLGMFALVACQNQTKKSNSVRNETEAAVVFTVDELQLKGDDYIGKIVSVKGTVSHVCKHSGQRCFLMGSSEDVTIRVEAGKKIGSFTQDQMGSELVLRGTLAEIRIDEAYVSEMETSGDEGQPANKEHALGHDDEGNHEVDGGNHAGNQMKKIAEMRDKIKKAEKGYISVYYLEGGELQNIQ